MAVAQTYTPALKISRRSVIRKERRLSLPGTVLASAGAKVKASDVVAQAGLPGPAHFVNLAGKLGIEPREIRKFLLKKEGEKISAGELIARYSGFFGMFRSELVSPISGAVEAVSDVTGKITLRGEAIPINLPAYVEGIVEAILPGEGVMIRSWGAEVQGIFGIGGIAWGPLHVAVNSPEETLSENALTEDCADAVLVGGSFVTSRVLEEAKKLRVKAVIAGGVDAVELDRFLGNPLGVAITGSEQKGITLIVTEGFGKIPMAQKTFNLLKSCEGRTASVNGATQIRAGVIRPEILIPFLEEGIPQDEIAAEADELQPFQTGGKVRVIREPYFGEMGRIIALPGEPMPLETEAKVRVAEVELRGGVKVIVPRANLEIFEG